jgi:hypothetical protein
MIRFHEKLLRRLYIKEMRRYERNRKHLTARQHTRQLHQKRADK